MELTDLIFKKAKAGELDEIAALYKDVIGHTKTCWDDDYPSRALLLGDIQNGTLFVLKKEGKIIASSFLGKNENEDDWQIKLNSPLSVARICVSPAFQGNGIGKFFLKKLIAKAKQLGADGMHFHVWVDNDSAIKMYEACGFKNCGIGRSAYGFDFFKFEQKF